VVAPLVGDALWTVCCKRTTEQTCRCSRIQRFRFDKHTGLLRRNDYTPVAASPTARAAHVIFEHAVSNGMPYPSKRRVKMSLQQYGWVLPFPDFITIDVERWQLR